LADPSAHSPLFSRYSGDADIAEIQQLYRFVREHHGFFDDELKVRIGRAVYQHYDHLPEPIRDRFSGVVLDLLQSETYLWELPSPDLARLSMSERIEYRNFLLRKRQIIERRDEFMHLLYQGIARNLAAFARDLAVSDEASPFTIPLVYALPNAADQIERILGTHAADEYLDNGILKDVAHQLYRNWCKASGRDPDDTESTKRFIQPTDSGLPLDEMVRTYLAGTPYRDLLLSPVPLNLTIEERFNHMHIVGGTGAGKTSLIENLILYDLKSADPPSLVIVDPHGDLIQKLTRADLGIEDRLIVVDPRDLKHPPALNVFALNKDRMQRYDDTTREQVVAGVIQTFDYLFSGLIGADLTAKQGIFFKYVARLMLSLPETLGRNATIIDMIRLMADDGPYRPAIERLPPLQREFFQHDFNTKTFAQTKEQIRYRLQAIVENPTLANLFTAPETKLDLFTEMNSGSIILVDTAKDFLKGGSANFGRIFISLVLQAVLERAALPERARKPTFLIVDEAASYFDSNIDDLLTEARKYRCGLVLAHQYLDQASSSLRSSLAANAGIKFAGGISAADARAMAAEMRTTQDFILSQPKLHFAAHIRNTTPQAVSIPIRPGALSAVPQLSKEAISAMIARNRLRVSLPQVQRDRPTIAPNTQVGDEDISREW
jgi:hypothetical protein